ncbi:lipase family protein [Burkholderia territorii]|uniref:lipase family protein n=1 Tax=Burkholderia territorii TaxID=1503055 RepID=UPI001E4FA5E1|nr:lipase [Burkholderia territorii]
MAPAIIDRLFCCTACAIICVIIANLRRLQLKNRRCASNYIRTRASGQEPALLAMIPFRSATTRRRTMTSSKLGQMQVNLTLAYVLNNAATDKFGHGIPHPTVPQVKKIIVDRLNGSRMTRNDQFAIVWGPAIVSDRNGYAANITAVLQSTATGEYSVVTSGTNFESPLDLMGDFSFGTLEPFSAYVRDCPSDARISAGTNGALFYVLDTPDSSRVKLADFLRTVQPSSVVNVIGHSLGGALASAIVLYLKNQSGLQAHTYNCQTFAGPTAGNAAFADYFNQQMRDRAVRVFNSRDIVPMAWNADTILQVKDVYSDAGLDTPLDTKIAVDAVSLATRPLDYAQWGTPDLSASVTTPMQYRLDGTVNGHIRDFHTQVGYQHIYEYMTCLDMALSDIDIPGPGPGQVASPVIR